jgi:hypothetical protein
MNRRTWRLIAANVQALLVLVWLAGIQVHDHGSVAEDHEHLHAAHADVHHHAHDHDDAHGHDDTAPDGADPIPDDPLPSGDLDGHVHLGVESVPSLSATEPPSLVVVSMLCVPLMRPDPQVVPDGFSADIDTPPVEIL